MTIPFFKRKKAKQNGADAELMGKAYRVMQASIPVDFDFDHYAQRHVFNRLSKKSQYGFYYYPYGYLFRYPKWGTLNDTGFRMTENTHEVRKKYPDHYVIAVFGGSTGFSILVPDEDCFTFVLEEQLNADNELRRRVGKPFKVVNLSHPGNMLLNQIISFTLFCENMKPDMVISHNGANDLCTAQMNDRNLVENYQLGYVDVLEAWGRKIHDAVDVEIDYLYAEPADPDFRPVSPRNRPEAVICAYHTRMKQFALFAQANGAAFISGFQPWITSKRALTPREQERLHTYNPYYQLVYSNMPMLNDMYDKLLDEERLPYVLNLHRYFGQLGDEETHFGDVCHTLAPGDRELARAYNEKVWDILSNEPAPA